MKAMDITGQKFGMLTAISAAGSIGRRAAWMFVCDCGKRVRWNGHAVRSGAKYSCGCTRQKKAK